MTEQQIQEYLALLQKMFKLTPEKLAVVEAQLRAQ
jgi:hypothetical protein